MKARRSELRESSFATSGYAARASPRGHLRVHTFPVIAAHELATALPDFLAHHPHITFDFMVTNRIVDLIGENVDVSLRMGPLEDSGLVSRKIVDLSRVVCASPGSWRPPRTRAFRSLVFTIDRSTSVISDCLFRKNLAPEILFFPILTVRMRVPGR